MLWSIIINFICDTFDKLIYYVPSFNVGIPAGFWDGLETLTKNIGYVLPINDLIVVFDIWVGYLAFRLGVTFYKHKIKVKV